METSKETTIETDSSVEKISPNANLIIEKYYEDCKHTVKTNSEIPVEMVNLTEEELKEEYKDWEVKEFSSNEVVLFKKMSGICGEHFVITIENNKVLVYKLDENYDKSIYEKTDISAEYLTDEDNEKLEEGIYVYGVTSLNSALESFE